MPVDLRERRANVFDLAIEDPERLSHVFNPDTDITEENWQKMINLYRSIKKVSISIEMLVKMHILSHERIEPLLDESIRNALFTSYSQSRRAEPGKSYKFDCISIAADIRELFPDDFSSLDFPESFDTNYLPTFGWSPDKAGEMLLRAECVIKAFPRQRAQIASLFPDSFWNHLKIDPPYSIFKHERVRIIDEERFQDLNHRFKADLPTHIAHLKTIVPSPASREDANIFWNSYAQFAATLKIVTAKAVTPTERGLEIVMPVTGLETRDPEIPEERSF